MKRSLVTLLMIMIGTLGLTACGSDNDAEKQSASSQNDNVLVKVNNQPITESDLELTITSLLGEYQASLLDKAGRHRALESMVMSRVIAQAAQKELTKQDRQKIEKRVAAHREKLLVNYYLRKHASVQPVSQKMVKAYYEKHPDKFGGKTVRVYEMIFSDKKIPMSQRNQVIQSLKGIESKKDWNGQINQLSKKGIALLYRKGNADEGVLNERIKALIGALKPGESSRLTFVQGKPYIVRLLKEEQRAAKPLSEVSTDIRKALVPVKLKGAINEVAEGLMKAARVEYMDK